MCCIVPPPLFYFNLFCCFRRTRSQTMSERLRKSIRQKLRPSIFTVCIDCIATWPLFNGISPLNYYRRARTAPTACWWRSARRRATSGSRATSAGNTLGHHTTSTIENIYLSLNCSISKLKLLNIKMLYSFMYSWVRPA